MKCKENKRPSSPQLPGLKKALKRLFPRPLKDPKAPSVLEATTEAGRSQVGLEVTPSIQPSLLWEARVPGPLKPGSASTLELFPFTQKEPGRCKRRLALLRI